MKNRKLKALIAAVALALTLGVSAVFGGCNTAAARDVINGKDLNIYDIYEAAKAESGNSDMTFIEFLREYLSYNPDEIENAVTLQTSVNRSLLSSVSVKCDFAEGANNGSGVIIDIDTDNGEMTVVTNCHVVYSAKSRRYADNIKLWLYGSESDYPATNANNAIKADIIAASKTYDVAVLKVTDSELVRRSKACAAAWSNAEEVYLGETVIAIGNAVSRKLSASVGYISKDSETIEVDLGDAASYEYTVLRTSATINSGSSGGGLYNLGGELIGLVNAKGKTSEEGFGYALTAASTKRVVKSMLDNYEKTWTEAHYVNRFNHGIVIEVADTYSTGLNASGYAEIYEQIKIVRADFRTPYSGKLNAGDVIKHVKITRGTEVVEDMDITREHNFHDVMLSVREDDTVEITVIRDGGEIKQTVAVDAKYIIQSDEN